MALTANIPQRVLTSLQRLLPPGGTGEFCLAFSGGLDSTVLLHAMAMIVREYPHYRLRTLHIDHQLQAASASWQDACAQACAQLGITFAAVSVTLDVKFPEGVEAEARRARYETFSQQLRVGEILLTAHHADDQLETVLLALTRGAGAGGLAAMPSIKPFASGWHVRPMLDCTRAELASWARESSLRWIDDPSNDLPRFDRNYLRSEVLPALRRRWPAVARSAARSASHIGEARELLDSLANADLARAAVGRCLDMRVVRELPPARRRNLLRFWLARCGARMPNSRKLAALEHDVLVADGDRIPGTHWDDVEVRRHGELLYCEKSQLSTDPALSIDWEWSAPQQLPGAQGRLQMVSSSGTGLARARLPSALQIRFRTGGERLQLAGHSHRSYLKNLLQEAHVLPWWRDRVPLLYADSKLAAVADVWVAEEFSADEDEGAVRVVWQPQPSIYAETVLHGSP